MENNRMQPLPSADPDRLAGQLHDAVLAGLPTRTYIRAVLADAWRAVHTGDPAALGRWRGRLARFGADARGDLGVRQLDEVLEIACSALRDGRVGPAERRLAEDLAPILRVLWERRGEPLSRADLFPLLGEQARWSESNTLSYPLEQLADAELVLLSTSRRKGGLARHYALSALGVRACAEIGLSRVPVVEALSPLIAELAASAPGNNRFNLPDHRWLAQLR